MAAAQRDEFAGLREAIGRCGVDRAAAGDHNGQQSCGSGVFPPSSRSGSHGYGTTRDAHGSAYRTPAVVVLDRGSYLRTWRILAALLPFTSMPACKMPPDDRHPMPQADAERGRLAMNGAGCGSCHSAPGVWPEGEVGPSLDSFAQQTLIAGRLPNRADILADYVRNAPKYVPQSGMPAMPLTEEEARDVAAYLYTLGRR
ncbi:c-type cytochrome [Sphingomonas parva]